MTPPGPESGDKPVSWFARLYDPLLAPLELLVLRRTRRGLVADAPGRVLEIGAGTGLNLPHYHAAVEVIATEPEPAMLLQARRRVAAARVRIRLVIAGAEALPFPDAAFDTVVATCVFCSVDDPERGFQEIHRVLKPGGELRLLEHVRGHSSWVARLQDRLTPRWSRIVGGCCLNRPTLETALAAGFQAEKIRAHFGGMVVRAWLRSI